MTNPINPLSRSVAGSVSINTEKTQTNKADSSTTSRSNAEDTVSLSQQSQQVSGLQQQLKDSPAIDQAKVDSIKQEIANGNYPLDAEKIAVNLINLEQSLLE
ncbi:MAG: flagellar biosynthesis anti-sigma factor FlgM [Gammaproteobacteria bacterium]|nr:flagellar biosynthesis anti-sigma factor FlgM [Gammaproteobacteria bacterium]